MFKRLTRDPVDAAGLVRLSVDGRTVEAQAGDSVAAALLAAGIVDFRVSPTAGTRRGPYCLMGVCFECLVTIDGRAGRQACMTPVATGMDVRTNIGSSPA
jgi:predicted molibdopterin-dependent oxidoreductase YjgC